MGMKKNVIFPPFFLRLQILIVAISQIFFFTNCKHCVYIIIIVLAILCLQMNVIKGMLSSSLNPNSKRLI